jgi:two-component system, NarL family, nitrate/nitrite response regulator NarL
VLNKGLPPRLQSVEVHILAVEDHALFLDGLRHLLRAMSPDLCLREARSREHALQLLEQHGSVLDLIVLDLAVPNAKPFELLVACRRLAPQAPVAVLSATEDHLEVRRAFELGAQGYLFKSTSNSEIIAALERVMQGEIVSPGFPPQPNGSDPSAHRLTARQTAVLRLLAQGLSNKEIAVELGLTENTVKVHLASCYRALGVTSRTAALRSAMRIGLIRDE